MDAVTKAGIVCLVVGILLFLLEGIANRKGFGQLIAVMRTTVLLIGIVMIIVGLIR